MLFKCWEAYSSVCPPDKKVTPTKAGGTVLDRALTVLTAYSTELLSFLLGCSEPYVTIFGFKRHPYKRTPFFCKAMKVAARTF